MEKQLTGVGSIIDNGANGDPEEAEDREQDQNDDGIPEDMVELNIPNEDSDHVSQFKEEEKKKTPVWKKPEKKKKAGKKQGGGGKNKQKAKKKANEAAAAAGSEQTNASAQVGKWSQGSFLLLFRRGTFSVKR